MLPTMMMTTIFAGPDDESCEGSDFQCQGTATNFDTLFWTTSGTGSFTNGNTFNALYNPSDDDIKAGQVLLSFNQYDVDGNFASDTMSLSFNLLPGIPDMPVGPELIDLGQVTSSDYTTNAVPGAESYQWSITPDSAGVLAGNDTLCTVTWNQDYEGEAMLKVRGVNGCGNSNWSDSLLVIVSIPWGIHENNQGVHCNIWPNPFADEFTIQMDNLTEHDLSIDIVNATGQTIRTINQHNVVGKWNGHFSLAGHDVGVYFVIIRSGSESIVKKIIKR